MQDNYVLFPAEAPPSLPAAQQKTIRDAMAAVASRGERFQGEIAYVRRKLSSEFAQFNADCDRAARAAKGKAS